MLEGRLITDHLFLLIALLQDILFDKLIELPRTVSVVTVMHYCHFFLRAITLEVILIFHAQIFDKSNVQHMIHYRLNCNVCRDLGY